GDSYPPCLARSFYILSMSSLHYHAPPTTATSPLSLHDALPIYAGLPPDIGPPTPPDLWARLTDTLPGCRLVEPGLCRSDRYCGDPHVPDPPFPTSFSGFSATDRDLTPGNLDVSVSACQRARQPELDL